MSQESCIHEPTTTGIVATPSKKKSILCTYKQFSYFLVIVIHLPSRWKKKAPRVSKYRSEMNEQVLVYKSKASLTAF